MSFGKQKKCHLGGGRGLYVGSVLWLDRLDLLDEEVTVQTKLRHLRLQTVRTWQHTHTQLRCLKCNESTVRNIQWVRSRHANLFCELQQRVSFTSPLRKCNNQQKLYFWKQVGLNELWLNNVCQIKVLLVYYVEFITFINDWPPHLNTRFYKRI